MRRCAEMHATTFQVPLAQVELILSCDKARKLSCQPACAGVRSLGPASARKLLAIYGDLESVLSFVDLMLMLLL